MPIGYCPQVRLHTERVTSMKATMLCCNLRFRCGVVGEGYAGGNYGRGRNLTRGVVNREVVVDAISREQPICIAVDACVLTSHSLAPRCANLVLMLTPCLCPFVPCFVSCIRFRRVVDWVQCQDLVSAASFSPDGQLAAAGLYNGRVMFYHTAGLRYYTQASS